MSESKPKYNEIIFSEEQKATIIDMYVNKKISSVEIGAKYNVSYKTILRFLERNNIERIRNGSRKWDLDEHYFDQIDTPNKAYILGFLYADGYNSIDKKTVRLQLQYTDKEILEKMRIELHSEKPLNYIKCSDKIASNGFISKDMYGLEFYSAYICEQLKQKGMVQNKSLVLKFPEWLDNSLYSHFIRGYFDGDGSYTPSPHKDKTYNRHLVTITSTNDFCIECLRILRKNCGIRGGIYDASCHNNITKVISIGGKNQCEMFFRWLYQGAEMFLQRKYNLYSENFLQNEKIN